MKIMVFKSNLGNSFKPLAKLLRKHFIFNLCGNKYKGALFAALNPRLNFIKQTLLNSYNMPANVICTSIVGISIARSAHF